MSQPVSQDKSSTVVSWVVFWFYGYGDCESALYAWQQELPSCMCPGPKTHQKNCCSHGPVTKGVECAMRNFGDLTNQIKVLKAKSSTSDCYFVCETSPFLGDGVTPEMFHENDLTTCLSNRFGWRRGRAFCALVAGCRLQKSCGKQQKTAGFQCFDQSESANACQKRCVLQYFLCEFSMFFLSLAKLSDMLCSYTRRAFRQGSGLWPLECGSVSPYMRP